MCLCGAECQYRDAVETVNGERDKWEHEMKQFAKVHTVNIYLLILSCRCMTPNLSSSLSFSLCLCPVWAQGL